MDHVSEIPLRSAKKFVRQLRIANKRHSRNAFLSSANADDSKDVE